MQNILFGNTHLKLGQMQRACAHQYEHPESESDDDNIEIQEEEIEQKS